MAAPLPYTNQKPGSEFPDAGKKRPDGKTDEEAGVPAADMRKGNKQNDPQENETQQPKDSR